MAQEISLLIPDFRKQLLRCIAAAREQKLGIEVISTVITPLEQGSLWRQGRTRTDAELKVMALQNAKANYLADCLQRAVAQGTNLATDLLPGLSWQQWGESAQIVWIDNGNKVNWSSRTDFGRGNGYRKFAEICQQFNIHSCGEEADNDVSWRTIRLRQEPLPTDVYTLTQIDAEMRRRFEK